MFLLSLLLLGACGGIAARVEDVTVSDDYQVIFHFNGLNKSEAARIPPCIPRAGPLRTQLAALLFECVFALSFRRDR